jgi:hypothetical protein
MQDWADPDKLLGMLGTVLVIWLVAVLIRLFHR